MTAGTLVMLSDAQSKLPLPPDLQTIFLGGLFVLAALTAVDTASAIILPVVLAFILKLGAGWFGGVFRSIAPHLLPRVRSLAAVLRHNEPGDEPPSEAEHSASGTNRD